MQLTGEPPPEDSLINVDVIYPATEKHVLKHSTQQYYMVQLTAYVAPGLLPSMALLPSRESTPTSGTAIVSPCLLADGADASKSPSTPRRTVSAHNFAGDGVAVAIGR